MNPSWRRRACVALLAMAACYETRATRLRVQAPTTRRDCAETRRLDAAFGEKRVSE